MADRYYDYNNGSSGNDGSTPALAKSTRSEAVSASTTGDSVIAVDGTHTHESGHFVFDDARDERAQTYRGATLRANAAETSRVARTSGSLTAANNPHLVQGFVFDGTSGNGTNSAFEFSQDASEDLILRNQNCEFISGDTYGILIQMRRGRIELVNAKITGVFASRALGATTSLSNDGNQVIDIQGCELAPAETLSGSKKVIELQQVGTPSNTLDLYFKGLRGTIQAATGATVNVLDIRTKDTMNVAGFNLTLQGEGTATMSGILMQGNASGYESSTAYITNGFMSFESGAGYGVSLGLSGVDSHITGGLMAGNTVRGKYFAEQTPHNFVIGQGVAAEGRGNLSIDGYVGFLLSICDDATLVGNVCVDCYGPSIYAKGTTAATIKDNTCVLTGQFTQRDRGILSVAPQGAVNTAGATFQENLVIVQDVSKIHSLAYIEDASQVCAFTRNVYIIPDTVDVGTADLFSYKNGAGGAANNTLAEWNAQTEVTSDEIVQMPSAEIARLVTQLVAQSGAASGLVNAVSNGLPFADNGALKVSMT